MSIFADGEMEAQKGDVGGHVIGPGAGIVTWICLVTKGHILSIAPHSSKVPYSWLLQAVPQLISSCKTGVIILL